METINAEYGILAYDVLQVSRDGGVTWDDYCTLRDRMDGRAAVSKVRGTLKWTKEWWRIYRPTSDKVVMYI